MPDYFEENMRRYREALKRGELSFGVTAEEKKEEPLWLRGWKTLLRSMGYAGAVSTGGLTGATGTLGNLLMGDVAGAGETFKRRWNRQMEILDTVESVHDTATALKATGAVLLDTLLNVFDVIGDVWVDLGRAVAGLGYGIGKLGVMATGDEHAKQVYDLHAKQYLKWLDWKRIGLLSMAIDRVTDGLGLAPTRTVYVRNKETGATTVHQVRALELPAFRQQMELEGREVVSVSGATTAEKTYSAILYGTDIVTPFPNSLFAGVSKVAWVVPKAEFRLAGMGIKSLSNLISKTPMGRMVEGAVANLEKNFGIPLTEKSIQFMRVLSPLQRIRNAQVEQAKQNISDIEEYLINGGGRFGRMLESDPQGLYIRYGDAVDGLVETRRKIEERIQQYMDLGLSEREATENVTRAVRKSLGMSMFALTGLPFNDDVIEMLQKADADPDRAYQIIKAWANERGYAPDMKVIQTIINGDYHLVLSDKTIDDAFIKQLNGVLDNPHLFLQYYLSPTQTVDEVQRIWLSGVDYSKADWRTPDLSEAEQRAIERIIRPYRPDIANRLGRSLALMMRSGDPSERKVIADMITIYLGSRGTNLKALANRLGREGDDAFDVLVHALERLDDPKTAKQVLEHLKSLQGQRLDNIELELGALRSMLERNGLGDLEVLLSKCSDAVATQTAKVSALLSLPAMEFVYNIMSDVGGSAIHVEDVLRSRLMQSIEAQGKSLSDLPMEAQRWLGGEVNYLRPVVMESEREAVQFLRDIAFASGLDENIMFAVLDANRHVQDIIATTLGYIPETERGLEPTIFNWGTWKQALADYAGRLESIGRVKEASDLHYALEKTDNIADMIKALRSMEEENHMLSRLRNDIFSYFGALLWRKDTVIHEANRILNELSETRYLKGFEFFSETPTATLYKRIEGTGTNLDGLYSTEYISNVLQRMTQGDDRLWKGWLDAFNNYLKKALVVWSPLAIVRDFVSNAGSVAFGMDLAPYQYPKLLKWYLNAWRSIRKGDEIFQEYAKYSPSAYTIADTIGNLEHEVLWGLAEASAPKRWLYKIGQLPFFKQMQRLRSMSEAMGKIAFVHALEDSFKDIPPHLYMEKFNMNERHFVGKAKDSMAIRVALAEKYLIDYNDVPPAIHFLRRYTGLFPFITWEAKMVNLLISDWTSRSVFLQRFFHALSTGEKMANADDPQAVSDVNLLKAHLRDNPLAFAYRDENGKIKIIDLSYFLPLGALLPLERMANNMLDVETYLREVRTRMGTVVPTLFEVLLNRDLFTGAEIYQRTDPPEEKVKKIIQHLGDNVPVPIVPKRLITNYVKDKEAETNIEEAFKQYNETTWWQALLSMYTIDPDKLVVTKAEQHLRNASRLVSEAKKAYLKTLNRTGDQREAEEAMAPFLREAEHQRFKAHELYDVGFRLRNVDKETSDLLLNPSVGYNPTLPREYIRAQTEVMTMVFNILRGRGAFDQRTDKWEILNILVTTTERFYRAVDALDDVNRVYSQLLDAVNAGNREVIGNWIKTNIDAIRMNEPDIPLEPPLLIKPNGVDPVAVASWVLAKTGRSPRYDVNGKPLGVQFAEAQRMFQNLMMETTKGTPSRLLLEAFNRWSNTVRKQFVPSQGNVPRVRGEER